MTSAVAVAAPVANNAPNDAADAAADATTIAVVGDSAFFLYPSLTLSVCLSLSFSPHRIYFTKYIRRIS